MDNYRVIADYKDVYIVKNENEERKTRVTGRYIHNAVMRSDYPVVGDWVHINSSGMIESIVDRKNCLSRKRAGGKYEEQIMAANIDLMFIVMSLNQDFNINKVARFYILAQTNEIIPVVVLTKADLCENIAQYKGQIEKKFKGIDVIVSGIENEEGIEQIKKKLIPGVVSVFVGASGAGKSTLVNRLLDKEVAKTGKVRATDNKGRHTTTNRQMYEMKNKSYIIDTPGIREIGLWINNADFLLEEDISKLEKRCKFRNCTHESEPGCAIIEAMEDGIISVSQYKAYMKLKREAEYAKYAQDKSIQGARERTARMKERELWRPKHR